MLVRDKHSSLLQTFVNYRHKKFYNTEPRAGPRTSYDHPQGKQGYPIKTSNVTELSWFNSNFSMRGKSAASFCGQVAALVPDMFCNFYLVKYHKIDNSSATNKAREKNEHIFGILRILDFFDACLTKFENYQILLNKISPRFLVTNKLLRASFLNSTAWLVLQCTVLQYEIIIFIFINNFSLLGILRETN